MAKGGIDGESRDPVREPVRRPGRPGARRLGRPSPSRRRPAAPRPPRRRARRPRRPAPAAPAAPKVDTGDTAWVLTSSALVLMMTAPGLALFYGGMVRRKNVLATLMQSFILMARHLGPVGALRLQPRVRARHRRHRRQPQVDRPVRRRRRAERRLRGDDPAPGLHGLPAHVRHHHARADHGRVRRAHEVLGLPPLLAPVGHPDLRPARPLGLGRRRVDPRAGRPRLRRRHGRPHLLGRLRARRRDRDRPAAGLRPGADAAPQPAVHRDRVGDALGRLVRLQRGERARRGRPRRHRLRHHEHGGGRRHARLDVRRVGDAAGSRPSSAPRPAPSRGSSRSRRPRASSGRSPRS